MHADVTRATSWPPESVLLSITIGSHFIAPSAAILCGMLPQTLLAQPGSIKVYVLILTQLLSLLGF